MKVGWRVEALTEDEPEVIDKGWEPVVSWKQSGRKGLRCKHP